jgi:epoxyqueuosine reductase QueG
MDPKSQIKNISLECGFDEVGVARLEKGSEGYEKFLIWLERGYQGEMDYLTRGQEKRRDPELVLEGAKSVIVLVWDYGRRGEDGNSTLDTRQPPYESPFISRYAWEEDYHLVLGKKLEVFEKPQIVVPFGPLQILRRYGPRDGEILGFPWRESAGLENTPISSILKGALIFSPRF